MPVSILLLTFNEELNLPRCLAAIAWCDDIVVLDSFSTDGTVATANAAGVRVFQRKFDNFAGQRHWRSATFPSSMNGSSISMPTRSVHGNCKPKLPLESAIPITMPTASLRKPSSSASGCVSPAFIRRIRSGSAEIRSSASSRSVTANARISIPHESGPSSSHTSTIPHPRGWTTGSRSTIAIPPTRQWEPRAAPPQMPLICWAWQPGVIRPGGGVRSRRWQIDCRCDLPCVSCMCTSDALGFWTVQPVITTAVCWRCTRQ